MLVGKSGSRYEGQFRKDKREGNGVERFVNGTVYEGEYKDDKFEGKGTFRWPDDCYYTGSWKAGVMEGKVRITNQGEYLMQDGKFYMGDFQNNKFEGLGTLKWKDGKTVYTGEFKAGRREGKGKITYPNGKIYEGAWKAGLEDGPGTLTTKDQKTSGIWKEGKLVEQKN